MPSPIGQWLKHAITDRVWLLDSLLKHLREDMCGRATWRSPDARLIEHNNSAHTAAEPLEPIQPSILLTDGSTRKSMRRECAQVCDLCVL
jgi:hypothetical protein